MTSSVMDVLRGNRSSGQSVGEGGKPSDSNTKQRRKVRSVKKAKRRQKKHAKPVDLAPKRPLSAYNLFFAEYRKQKQTASDPPADNTEKSIKAITRTVANQWNSMDESAKAPYRKRAEEDLERYKKELQARQDLQGFHTPKRLENILSQAIEFSNSNKKNGNNSSPFGSPVIAPRLSDSDENPPVPTSVSVDHSSAGDPSKQKSSTSSEVSDISHDWVSACEDQSETNNNNNETAKAGPAAAGCNKLADFIRQATTTHETKKRGFSQDEKEQAAAVVSKKKRKLPELPMLNKRQSSAIAELFRKKDPAATVTPELKEQHETSLSDETQQEYPDEEKNYDDDDDDDEDTVTEKTSLEEEDEDEEDPTLFEHLEDDAVLTNESSKSPEQEKRKDQEGGEQEADCLQGEEDEDAESKQRESQEENQEADNYKDRDQQFHDADVLQDFAADNLVPLDLHYGGLPELLPDNDNYFSTALASVDGKQDSQAGSCAFSKDYSTPGEGNGHEKQDSQRGLSPFNKNSATPTSATAVRYMSPARQSGPKPKGCSGASSHGTSFQALVDKYYQEQKGDNQDASSPMKPGISSQQLLEQVLELASQQARSDSSQKSQSSLPQQQQVLPSPPGQVLYSPSPMKPGPMKPGNSSQQLLEQVLELASQQARSDSLQKSQSSLPQQQQVLPNPSEQVLYSPERVLFSSPQRLLRNPAYVDGQFDDAPEPAANFPPPSKVAKRPAVINLQAANPLLDDNDGKQPPVVAGQSLKSLMSTFDDNDFRFLSQSLNKS